jgi:hypothetical protein
MSALRMNMYSWHRVWRLAIFALGFTGFVTARAVVANAQTTDLTSPRPSTTTPQAYFQYSALTGSGNTVLATRVSAVTSAGKTIYWDVTLLFDVASDGTLTLDPSSPQIVPSPNLLTNHFLAGNYQGPSDDCGGGYLITITGPGVGSGGSTDWSLASSTGACAYMYPISASWYVGTYASNPLEARLKAAGISQTEYVDYSWGSGDSSTSPNNNWGTNTLMGFSQNGGSLTITSFTHNGVDSNLPQDVIVYNCISGACAAQ